MHLVVHCGKQRAQRSDGRGADRVCLALCELLAAARRREAAGFVPPSLARVVDVVVLALVTEPALRAGVPGRGYHRHGRGQRGRPRGTRRASVARRRAPAGGLATGRERFEAGSAGPLPLRRFRRGR